MQIKELEADVLIVGGGAAGCYAAFTLAELEPDCRIILADKADIRRSGCLAAGVNALNAYITKNHVPEDYVDYASHDAAGIVREDLLLSMANGLNRVTKRLEELGLVLLKDKNGDYVARGERNIKINGENIKPLLAAEVCRHPTITLLNHVNIIDYIKKGSVVAGAYGIGIKQEIFYAIQAKAVICATGGAAGLYRPNNPGFSQHKMWYSPFNTGAGYAMGIRAGAEMTTFEMRFIALRCKDTISPTGTLAQGVHAPQINSRGEEYQAKYGNTTSERVYATVAENLAGRGPCYLKTEGITQEQELELRKAYLNMSPAQTLKWIEAGKGPSERNVEIEGTEPYVVGGHTASGYWINDKRQTTLQGLYAAGDVAGGCPQKYVTGAFVEGELAAKAVQEYIFSEGVYRDNSMSAKQNEEKYSEVQHFFASENDLYTAAELEEAMQKTMDDYAGGIARQYRFNETQLNIADKRIRRIEQLSNQLGAKGELYKLLQIYELRERLMVCKVLIAHLRARKETRWHSFAENLDYPDKSSDWERYVNSKLEDGEVKIIFRELIRRGEHYEHKN
jgi:adenylylsulfate reductase, subunit A